jgi:integrase
VVHGRRREIGLGSARLVELREARDLAREFRRIARSGGDPVAERDKAKRRSLTFEEAARKVHAEQIVPNSKSGKHVWQWLDTLEKHAFPKIGALPIHAVLQSDILRVLAPVWLVMPETARRIRQRLRLVFDWARAAGHRDDANPVDGVEKGLPKQKDKPEHFKALPWSDVPALLQRVAAERGMGPLALRFAILTAARSGEVRGARWSEIDLDAGVWTIPGARMKAGEEHRVPLSEPARNILAAVQGVSPDYVFPSKTGNRPLSDMTLAKVLKKLSVLVTVHGFRSTFRDWAEEATSTPHEVKEAALAHRLKSKSERAYRRTDLFEKRRALMEAWGSYATGGEAAALGLRDE